MASWNKQPYTLEEDTIIREMYLTHTAREIHEIMPHHTQGSISVRAQHLGLTKSQIKKVFFTPEEDAIVQEMYPTHTAKEIRSQFLPNRSIGSIQARGINLGVKKDPAARVEDTLDEMPLIITEDYKTCTRCQEVKARKHFRKDRTRSDGLCPYCKICAGILDHEWRKNQRHRPKLVLEEGQKKCTICGEIKPLEAFYRNRKAKDGRWPRCKECDDARRQRSYEVRSLERTNRYTNFNADDYKRMLEEQGSACAVCGQPETIIDKRNGRARALAIDHCHTTDAIRGLLCAKCNQALGLLGEDPDRVKALLKYIEERCLW